MTTGARLVEVPVPETVWDRLSTGDQNWLIFHPRACDRKSGPASGDSLNISTPGRKSMTFTIVDVRSAKQYPGHVWTRVERSRK